MSSTDSSTSVESIPQDGDADDALYIRGLEIGVAATNTFVTQVVSHAMVGLWLGSVREERSPATARDTITGLNQLPGPSNSSSIMTRSWPNWHNRMPTPRTSCSSVGTRACR